MSKVFNMVGGGGGGGPAASIFVKGLSQTDTVTATNGSKTKAGVWTQKPNPVAHGLPDGYTELEYIQSTGTQYIDTGVVYESNYSQRFVTDIAFLSDTNIIGYGITINGPHFGIVSSSLTYGLTSDVSTGVSYSYGTRLLVDFNTFEDYLNVKNQLTGGTLLNITSLSGNKTLTSNPSLKLFAYQNASGLQCRSQQIYSFDVYKSGEIVRKYIPAKRNSDSVVGMYDLITDEFFGNSGTGTFTAGAEVPQTFDGFLIDKIKDFGTWTVTATNGEKTATQDVLVDVITEYEIEMSLTS